MYYESETQSNQDPLADGTGTNSVVEDWAQKEENQELDEEDEEEIRNWN